MENKKIIELAPFDECTGCAVCAAECPKHAINMVYKNGSLAKACG
ncbi:4Fe-4S binding protein [Segatella copri]|nr:4Fe-4S binding protein [Segatella copri]MDV3120354.1 4Fe-4S binding protein [Segatella copri]